MSNIEDIYSLSPTQHGLLFHSVYEPDSRVYYQQLSLDITGPLDTGAFRRAWQALMQRHAVLRTAFLWEDLDDAYQVVQHEVPLPLSELDWRDRDEVEEALRQCARQERDQALELNDAPLMRLCLVRLPEQRWHLIWTFHHILMDGWSVGVAIQQWLALYYQQVRGDNAGLPSSRGYRDYIAWLAEQDVQATEHFWREQLQDFSEPTPLPSFATPPEAPQAHPYAERETRLDAAETERLNQFARSQHLTVNTLIQGAWALLLGQHAGRDEVVYGVTVAGRPDGLAGVDSMVGLFINTLPLRVRLDDSRTLGDWLQDLQRCNSDLRQHAYLPLSRLKPLSQVPAERALFDSILVFENFPVTDALNQDAEGLRFSAPPEQRRADGIRLTQGRNHFPLSLIVVPGERLEYLFSYDRSRFSDAEIALLSAQLRALLLAMAEQPQARLQALDWLSAEERLRLEAHGQGAHLAVAASTLQQRFVAGAQRHPERLAVQDRSRALSYAELDAEANRLAHRLQAQGIGSGQLLALALERSVDFVVALLATLKCGAAYLPLDLKQPAGRLADILQDSRADLLISQRALESRLPRSESPARLWLDDEASSIAALPSTAVQAGDDPDAPAYVIYTSGSTGTPKGVVVEHRAIVGYLAAVAELLDPPPAARYGLLSTVAADLGHTQLFGALCNGGSLILVDEDTSFDPLALADFLGEHPVDVLKITPGHLQGLLQAHPDPRLLPRERLVFGGDALKPELLRQVGALAPALRLFNHYGPSEATVGALATPLAADIGLVALGRPLANRRLQVVDGNGRQVAIGVPGELWIAGDLARGYLHRADLTAERFVDSHGQRWYRTGDRVRWLTDGQLAFLGRVDNQVKIRGNRIELGEVEAQIRRLSPLIEQVLVRVLEVDATPRLVAYVVASQSLSASKLCDDLGRRVPDYMVPAHVITLDAIPLTANGKPDLRQLPLPSAPAADAASHVAPRNEVEALLARIWQEVLKVERVGVHDNFFSLGGDSILNLQIIARANQQGLKLTPKQLFENRTIADIAQVLGAGAESAAARQQGDGFAIPLSAGQHARLQSALQPSWRCLSIADELSTSHLAQALTALQGHHQALRLALQRSPDGEWQQRVLSTPAPLEVSEYRHDDEPLQALAEAAFNRLDLAAGQGLHASLLRGEAGDRLLLVAHPLCLDEAAWPLLLTDLNLALTQLRYQRPIRLSYTGGELAAWCEHQQQDASSERLDEVWEHWLQFAGLELPALDLSGQQDGQAEERLDADTSARLKRLVDTLQLDWNALLASSLVERLGGESGAPLALTLQAGRPDATHLPLSAPIARADLDPARILGTLALPVPFYLQAPSGDTLARLQDLAAQLRAYPQFGADYGTLRHLADNPYLLEPLRELPTPALALRWLGDWDAHREEQTVLADIQASSHEPAVAEGLNLDACWHENRLHLRGEGPLASTWLPGLVAHLQALAVLADSAELRPASSAFPLCHGQAATLASEPLPWARLEDLYPLSPMQQGMLLHTLLQPHSGIYLMQQRYSWDGELQRPAMERAWKLFLERHPMLRTAFWWQDDHEPLQCVYRDTELAFEWYDWRHLDAERQREAMDAVLADERQRGFDMSRAPLTYLRVFQLAEQRFSMVRSFHHILTDAWCFGLLMEDLLAIYQALARGEAVARPRWRPFRGYMSWLTRQDMDAAQAFWRNELVGFEAPTPLQVDLPVAQPDRAPEVVGDCNSTLSVASTQRLQQLCQTHQLTPNTWIQGAWALLLSRYSGNRDVLFGVTVAGRPTALAGVEEMVGLFINSLPLRVDVDPERPVIDWLQALLSHNAELRDHEYAPLVEIQRSSEIPRGQQLFDSLVVFENAPLDVASVRLDGFSIDIYEDRVHTNFPMTVVLYPGDRLGIRLSYDQGRFSADSVQRMLGHLVHLLGEMLEQPEAPLGHLQMLPEAERRQLLVDWNRSAADFPLQRSYAALFADQVRAHPQRLAAVCAGETLSYAELDRRSNAIAHALQQAGAGPDTLVALAAERGLALLCMMIATLRAGAAFQALDIQHPPQRLGELLELSGAPLLLVDEKASGLLDRVLAGVTRQPGCLVVQELWQRDAAPVQYAHRPDQLAYVIFTSGSTGTPKGALVEQRGMLNNIFGKVPTLGLCSEDRIAQTASPAFDISIWQFLAAPIVGATVHILPDTVAHDPAALLDAIETQRLNLLEAVPTLIRGLLQEAGPHHQLGSLRWLLPTGEALPPALARDWRSRFPGTPLMNAYGPAECSDDVAFHAIHEASEGDCAHMPIGRPTANNQLYILDADLRPQPIGVPGELCVAGVGVGRGYLGDAERTRTAFVDHPFAPGARFYRTGDIGRYRADGVIEYLGRRDQQVKIRGHRIELGEIENRLMRHPQVGSAVVLALPDARGDLQLLACYVPRDAAPDAATAQALLVEHLRGQLASYMVPGHWRRLERLPLNANGKVDRRALAALGLPSEASAQAQVAPRTPTEQALAELWQDLLGLTSLSIDDDFFALGGHSLLATQVVARIRRRLAVELPLRALFEHRTVAELAKVVDAQAPNAAAAVEEIVAVPRSQALPLSYAQQRLWFLDKLEGPSAAYNLSTAVRLDGELDVEALHAALQHVLDRHESLRTGFILDGDTPRQVIADTMRLELPLQSLAADDDAQVQHCIDEEAARPFDLQRPPMLRARLLRLGEKRHVLQFTLHHIATDAWSMGILVEEAIAAYSAYRSGHAPALAALPIQYADYAHWQRSPTQQQRLARDVDFWRSQLQGAPMLLRLPLDKPRPAQADYQGAALRQTLPRAQVERLQAYAQTQRATLFMVLLNAFNCLLQRVTGDDDFLVGTDLANREQPALERLIGFFVNVLPLRARLDPAQDFSARLQRLRDDTLAAFQHQQVPFDKLVETLQPPRQAGVNPLVQTLLVLQNTPRSSAELPGLHVEHLAPRQETSKFDLALFAEEDQQGLTLRWVYRTSLFQADTIEQLQRGFDALLQRVIEAPEHALQGWDWRLHSPAVTENAPMYDASTQDEASRASRKLSKLSKLKQTRATAVSLRPEEQVRSAPLAAERALPLLIEPRLGELDPVSWAQQARGWIGEQLRRHGGLLFRGFDLPDASAFEQFAQAIEPDLYGTYGDLPKNNSGKNIYHSTPYPEQHMILFHNESSHLAQWPRKQWFYCEKPAPQGGCTPIVDCREVLARLPQPIVEKLRTQGLLYVRHFTDKLDVRWQDFFKTEHREEVEQRCREAGTQWQWLGEDGLRIAQRCPAIVHHPDTDEASFFNQVQLHHPACLEPEVRSNLLELFGPEHLPRNVCYGDGSPIEDEVMAEIGRVYEACAVRFAWQKGDVVMLDNMLVAHARDPFEGERKICVAMGQMMRREELDALEKSTTRTDLQLQESR